MNRNRFRFGLATIATGLLLTLAACGGGGSTESPLTVVTGGTGGGGTVPGQGCTEVLDTTPSTVNGPAWWSYGRDSQRSAQGAIATQPMNRVVWRTPVDLAPQYSGTSLLAHYGSPIITARNTVIVPVKTGANGGFRIEARSGSTGALRWQMTTDYVLPAYRWVPSFTPTLTSGGRLYVPAAGGILMMRSDVDTVTQQTVCGGSQAFIFYGGNLDAATTAIYKSSVFINTPLTADAAGNIFFGFIVTGPTPANLVSGIARVSAGGQGSWVAANLAANDNTMTKVATNSAPAISPDGRTVYVAVNGATQGTGGYLLALDSATLATTGRISLLDVKTGGPAWVSDDSTASPTVGPDGDVYFGVLEANAPGHNYRGWLLHFDAGLTTRKIPGSFGWDTTASILPASMVPSYSTSSSYLLMTKYNNYRNAGSGDGRNQVAILDPSRSQADAIGGATVMREVLTLLGPTLEAGSAVAVREWCINSAAVDPLTGSVIVNNEDGRVYRWSLATNTLTQSVALDSGIGQAYTPTAIGPDGKIYAINNAILFAVGQ